MRILEFQRISCTYIVNESFYYLVVVEPCCIMRIFLSQQDAGLLTGLIISVKTGVTDILIVTQSTYSLHFNLLQAQRPLLPIFQQLPKVSMRCTLIYYKLVDRCYRYFNSYPKHLFAALQLIYYKREDRCYRYSNSYSKYLFTAL